jgi:two-component system, OmpR family, alkaline phosphatase synthesis response regulator PhoP
VAKILVVEDDPAVRDVVEHALSREGMETATVENGEEALERLRGEPFDLVVLDVMLPGIDGISVCRELRADGENGDIPVVMLTARDDEINVVVGLEVGADDYVTKPFSPRELVSRVRAHLRRRSLDARKAEASSTAEKRLEFPGLTVDLLRRQVVLGGKEVELTAREFDVLALLASHPGRVYSREQIMRHLWDGDFFGEARAADVHVQNIRHKVEPDPKNPRYVRTVRGAGYRFAEF